jgi:hypothetical protein
MPSKNTGNFPFLPGIGKPGKPGIKKSSSNDENITVYVGDPASGLIKYSKEEFLKCWLSTTKGVRGKVPPCFLSLHPIFTGRRMSRRGSLSSCTFWVT